MAAEPISHINLDKRGIAYIAGTKMKVMQIVWEKNGLGLTPEQIRFEHPHLSLAQIYAALTYYYDHQANVDAQMAAWDREYEEMRAAAGESPFVKRMRDAGRLP